MKRFNAAILDKIIASIEPQMQREIEWTIQDLMDRGAAYNRARYECELGLRQGRYERRIGICRRSGRKAWLYREKGAKV